MSNATQPLPQPQPEVLDAVRFALSESYDGECAGHLSPEAPRAYVAYCRDPFAVLRDRFGDDEVDACLAWIEAEAEAAMERDERRCGEEG